MISITFASDLPVISKTEPGCQLSRARRPRTGDCAKSRVAQSEVGDIENRVVQKVVEFTPQIEPEALRDGEALLQGDIRAHHRRAAQARSRRVSEPVRRGIDERSGVEPP